MISDLFFFLRFHFQRLFAAQPLALVVLSLAGFGAVGALVAYWQQTSLVASENALLLELRGNGMLRNANLSQIAPTQTLAPSLPWFQGADVVAQLNRIADNTSLPVDEVGYQLDEGANQPYLRYRVTMTVTASYPAVRRFVRSVTARLNNVDLDAISCARSDINVATLSCDLAFSAFFRKDERG